MKWTDKQKRIAFVAAMALLLTVIGIVILSSAKHVQGESFVIFTCVINILLFMVQLLLAIWKHPFSFDMMFWLFNLFFFGYAPLLQHLTNVYAWDLKPTFSEVLQTNLLILLWSVCYIVGRDSALGVKLQQFVQSAAKKIAEKGKLWLSKLGFALKKSKLAEVWEKCKAWLSSFGENVSAAVLDGSRASVKWTEDHSGPKLGGLIRKIAAKVCRMWERQKKQSARMKAMNVLLLVSVLIMLCHIVVIGFTNLFSRSSAEVPTSNTTIYLLFTHGFKNIVLFTAALFVIRMKKTRKIDFRTVVAVVCLLVCCFPTAVARNMMASFYAGLLIITVDKSRKGRWFSLAVLCGLVLLFPAIEVFRYAWSLKERSIWSLLLSSFQSTYLGGHYDAYQMFISVQKYVGEFGITWGGQMLGALLFFVPRAIWPGKPVGTGHTVITALEQYYFTNVSAPLVAEGYVNFGVVGIIGFALAVGVIGRVLDERYWKNRNQLSLIRLVYPFTIFQFFFLLRGDMMSGWAYLCAQVIVGTAVYLLVIYRTKSKKLKQS